MKIHYEADREKCDPSINSMIDIVFLLLFFFVMLFNVVDLEGDFSIQMPLQRGPVDLGIDSTELSLQLRMQADQHGQLSAMFLNDLPLDKDFDRLRDQIVWLVANDRQNMHGPTLQQVLPEIEIDTDYNLRYAYVIQAVTAVSGYKNGDQVVKLIDRVKFAKPRS